MKLLYSNILPLGTSDGQESIIDHFMSAIDKAAEVDIAVGYVSRASLIELDRLIHLHNIKKILLIIGMYFIEGMPEGSYHTALNLNEKWQNEGIGEIRLVKAFKYHGKAYLFRNQEGLPFDSIVGSSNLGVIKLEASNRRQYEFAVANDSTEACRDLQTHLEQLATTACSANIADIDNIPLIREENSSLENIDYVSHVPSSDIDIYKKNITGSTFTLPIKVPAFDERFMDDMRHYTKSNINVCYAAPRNARKSRDWYETQFTVDKSITLLPGYPEKNKPFFVATDDGYWFKAHTTSDGNKQLSACGDELILGRWIKGRLAAAGLVSPVNNTKQDTDRLGMITKEMLVEYGCDSLKLTKTTKQAPDGENMLDIWLLTFSSSDD